MKITVSSFKWSPDSKSIAFTATDGPTPDEEKAKKEKNDARVVDENIKMSRLYVGSAAATDKKTPRLLTEGNFSVAVAGHGGYDWSPDGKTIAFTRTDTPHADYWTSADISLVNVADGVVRPLVKTGAAEYSPHYSPDGKWIAYVASDNPPTWAGTGRVHVIAAVGGKAAGTRRNL